MDHLTNFITFCTLETATGGPDPHMAIIGEAIKDASHDFDEQAWRAICYVGPYMVSTAAILWHHWPLTEVQKRPEEFRFWIQNHWQGLLFRRERRAARSIAKFADCLLSGAEWITTTLPQVLLSPSYELPWKAADGIRYFGRYAKTKLLETLNRYVGLRTAMPDIRPQDAWSPRLTLSMIYPDHAPLLNEQGNSPAALQAVNALADKLLFQIKSAIPALTYFQYEVLLCNYRQAIAGKYPGRPHDTELGYFHRAEQYWGVVLLNEAIPFYTIRQHLFPNACLGELQGWEGPRPDLEAAFRDYSYFWSDLSYDYAKTDSLMQPKKRL